MLTEPLTDDLRRTPYHIGLAAREMTPALELLGTAFGVEWSDPHYMEPLTFWSPSGAVSMAGTAIHSLGGPMHLEVLEGRAGTVWETDRVVELHHHGYWSEDVGRDAEALQALGWSIEVCAVDANGRPATFAYLNKPGQFRIELVDVARQPHYCLRVHTDVPLHV